MLSLPATKQNPPNSSSRSSHMIFGFSHVQHCWETPLIQATFSAMQNFYVIRVEPRLERVALCSKTSTPQKFIRTIKPNEQLGINFILSSVKFLSIEQIFISTSLRREVQVTGQSQHKKKFAYLLLNFHLVGKKLINIAKRKRRYALC